MDTTFGAIPDSTVSPRDPPWKVAYMLPGSSARTVRSVHRQGNCDVGLGPRERWVVRSPGHPMAHNRVFQAAGVEAVRALCSPSPGVGIGPTSDPSGQLPAPASVATRAPRKLISAIRKPQSKSVEKRSESRVQLFDYSHSVSSSVFSTSCPRRGVFLTTYVLVRLAGQNSELVHACKVFARAHHFLTKPSFHPRFQIPAT